MLPLLPQLLLLQLLQLLPLLLLSLLLLLLLLQGQRSMSLARSIGVRMCFGSDLLGALHK